METKSSSATMMWSDRVMSTSRPSARILNRPSCGTLVSVMFRPDMILRRDRIAFWSNRSGLLQIYTMNTDGTQVTNISNTAWDEYSPIWVKQESTRP
mgnify:CR=1 FL=1